MYEKNKIAILTPDEYEQLRDAMRIKHRVLSDFLLMTGMRYAEVRKVKPNWYNRASKTIHLPQIADGKRKRTTPDRYVHLSTAGKRAADRYFEEGYKFPSYIAFDQMLRGAVMRSGLAEPEKILSVKSFRKTWESWLVATYPDKVPLIAMSQGHTDLVAMKHYLNIPFSSEEKKQMLEYVTGWIEH